MPDRNVGHRAIVLLWAHAGGMCSHPDCKMRLILEASGKDEVGIVGEVAHIIAASPRGPRGRKKAPRTVNSDENLILLCRNHHATVDEHPETYPVDLLRSWKADHEAWVATVTTLAHGASQWTAIVQESAPLIDVQEARAALGSGHRVVAVAQLRGSPQRDGWQAVASAQRESIAALLEKTPLQRRRFAIFSLAGIPLAVQLGFLLTDRTHVALFQYHRHTQTWAWPPDEEPGAAPQLSLTQPGRPGSNPPEAALRVSLSAPVTLRQARCDAEWDIEIAVPEPHKLWLRSPAQLEALSLLYERALSLARERECRRIHLFYAGPAPGAIAFGRVYNPSMNPPLQLYEFSAAADPPYTPVLELNRA